MVRSLLSSHEGDGSNSAIPLKSYADIFEEQFPNYLSIGMTEEQYWDRDCTLVIAYRKAEELRANRINQELWLQGAYIYDALCRVSPILHAFSKKGSKPEPYCSEPYSITRKQSKLEQRKKEKAVFDKGKRIMEGFVTQHNKKFERK